MKLDIIEQIDVWLLAHTIFHLLTISCPLQCSLPLAYPHSLFWFLMFCGLRGRGLLWKVEAVIFCASNFQSHHAATICMVFLTDANGVKVQCNTVAVAPYVF